MFDIRKHRPELVNPAERAPISRLDLPDELRSQVIENLNQRGFPVVEQGTGFVRARATEEQWAEFGTHPAITRQVEPGTGL